MPPEMKTHDTRQDHISSGVSMTDYNNVVQLEEPDVIEICPSGSGVLADSKEHLSGVVEDAEATPIESETPFSVFTTTEKRLTLVMAAASAFISPLSSSIYLPALNTLSQHYHVSNSLINLTVTSYLIFQGIGPTIFGDFADQAGRRPAYLTAFTVYLATNVALALQNSYAALLVLRMLQSTGSSASLVIGMGVIADLTLSHERGTYLGFVTAGVMFGPAISPVIGGLLAQYLGWRSIFWFLVIAVGIFLIPFAIFVPETCRKIVGNGSIPARGWNMSLRSALKDRTRRKALSQEIGEQQRAEDAVEKMKIRFPNPLGSLKLIFEKDVAIILFYNSICYMSFQALTVSNPSFFKEIYGFNDLIIGLCYLPYAFGGIASSIIVGKILDINYRRLALKKKFPIDYKRGNDLRNYPIELARMQVMLPILSVSTTATIGYGWAMQHSAPLFACLILQFILGFCYVAIFQIATTLLVDLYPMSPSTVSASNNLIRCSMGAVATAVLNPMLEGIGRGWTFTVLTLAAVVMSPALVLLIRKGPGWREERRLRLTKREEEKERKDVERT